MQIAIGVSHLLTWQWVAFVAMLLFFRPLGGFLRRASEFKIGRKGLSAKASLPDVPQPGELEDRSATNSQMQERVEAKQFVLRDSSGKKRAELGMTDTNSALLTLYDGAGLARVNLYAAEQGASVLAFHDSNGEARIILASSDHRAGSPLDEVTAGFSIQHGKGHIAVGLIVDAEGNPALDLYAPSGLSLFNAQ
jgi:hypothetical protein